MVYSDRVFKIHFPCHSERSEESNWTLAPLTRRVTAAGFFALLRMTKQLRTRPNQNRPLIPATIFTGNFRLLTTRSGYAA